MSKVIASIVIAFLIFIIGLKFVNKDTSLSNESLSQTSSHKNNQGAPENSDPNDFSTHHMVGYADEKSSPNKDIQLLDGMLMSYLTLVKTNDPLPLGENREITKALMGANIYKTKVLSQNPQWINELGELVDRWGTPIFFHVIDQKSIGIRSAGPDKIMWNEDDFINNEYAEEVK